jgi:hypothetical protein
MTNTQDNKMTREQTDSEGNQMTDIEARARAYAEKITGWVIRHPGTGVPIVCSTFEECMDKWFEGFNVPVLHIEGRQEPMQRCSTATENSATAGKRQSRTTISETANERLEQALARRAEARDTNCA